MFRRSLLVLCILTMAFHSSCGSFILGVSKNEAERSIKKDPIEWQIMNKVVQGKIIARFMGDANLRGVHVQVERGLVFLTGATNNSHLRHKAEKIAREIGGSVIYSIVNYIKVGDTEEHMLSSSAITSSIVTCLSLYPVIRSWNYSVKTIDGIVYLTGIASTYKELDEVIRIARSIHGVKRVVSHVKIKGEELAKRDVHVGPNYGRSKRLADDFLFKKHLKSNNSQLYHHSPPSIYRNNGLQNMVKIVLF